MRRLIVSAIALIFVATSQTARAATLQLPLTTQQIETYLKTVPDTTLEQFLSALPPSLNESFTLMHTSRSLHEATPLQPRQILFGADARFLIAVSSVDADPRRDLLEFAEFDPLSGRYHFGTIDFTETPRVARDVELCRSCHGEAPRPIWGQYPNWDGAYGDNAGSIAASVQSAFAEFTAKAPQLPRYKNLRFSTNASASTFLLPARQYPYPNTDFNHELGNTVALGTVTRMEASPNFARYRWAILGTSSALSCIDSNDWDVIVRSVNAAYKTIENRYAPTTLVSIKAQRILGVDPVAELSLERLGANVAGGTAGVWQTGAFRIDEAVAFFILADAIADDATLAAWFQPQQETIDFISRYAAYSGAARAEALKTSYGWFRFFDVFDPIIKNRSTQNAVCHYFAQKIGAAQ